MQNTLEKFRLDGKVCIITGGAGFLGKKHAEAVLDAGGLPVLLDIDQARIESTVKELKKVFKKETIGFAVDITDSRALLKIKEQILEKNLV